MAKLRTALYYKCLQWQPENLSLLFDKFDLQTQEYPLGGASRQEVVFWPPEYAFHPAQYPDTRWLVNNTSYEQEYQGDRITIISNWDSPEALSQITATAEHTMGLIHSLHRSIPYCHSMAKFGFWKRREMPIPEGQLSEMTLGILGMGRIGSMVWKRSEHLFQHRYDLVDGANLSDCDIVSIHVPLNDNIDLVDASFIGKMKPGAYLINTSRGEIVNPYALLDALEAGHLAGAALDVLPGEFTPTFQCIDHPLVAYARENDNLILTPHIGGSVRSAWRDTERFCIDKILEVCYETSFDHSQTWPPPWSNQE